MFPSLIRILPILGLTGCLIFPFGRRHHHHHDDSGFVADTGGARFTDTSPPEPASASEVDLRFHPGGVVRGEAAILSLVDHEATPVGLAELTDVDFLGPGNVRVTALQVRGPREVTLSVFAGARGSLGPVSALLTFADGSGYRLAGALVVVDDARDVPGSAWMGEETDQPEDTDAGEPGDTDPDTDLAETDAADTDPGDTDPADTDTTGPSDSDPTDTDTDAPPDTDPSGP
jgi:hypothetical protein